MAYITESDVSKVLPIQELVLLTDDSGSGTVDSANFNQCVADSEAIINAYLRPQHSVPLTTPGDLIKKIDIELTIFHLNKRRDTISEAVRNYYDDNLKLLNKISTGSITINDPDSFRNTGGRIQSNKSSTSKVYTSSEMDKF